MISLLDPLFASFARLTVARGILFTDLMERLKFHYIKAAKNMAGGKTTDSRLSVITGLQRRDIVRLREFSTKQQKTNHLSRLVALWQTNVDYAPAGKPVYLAKNGPAPSFESLAQLVRRDVHPRTMLDELCASGTVSVNSSDQSVQLLKTSYQPLSGSEDQLAYLSQNMADHLHAATENILGHTPPHFERAVHYSDLTASQIEELKTDYNAAQMALLEKLSQKAAKMKKLQNGDATHKFRAGGYFFHVNEGEQ